MEKTLMGEGIVPVYCYPNPHLHSFQLCLYVKSGIMYEEKKQQGITHFFEHIAIRNINAVMKGTLFSELDKMGLCMNGTTYKEFVQFDIGGACTHFRKAAEIFLKLFHPLCLSEQSVVTERKRVEAEIRESKVKDSVCEALDETIWGDTALSGRILGKTKVLKAQGLEELNAFRKTFFVPDQMLFYLTGNVPDEELTWFLKQLSDAMKLYEITAHTDKANTQKLRSNLAERPKSFGKRKPSFTHLSGSYAEAALSFDVETEKYSDACLNLFYDMLMIGDFCPVYQELSEKSGLIYSYDSEFERYGNIGALKMNFEAEPKKLYRALKKTMEVFEQVKQGNCSLTYARSSYLDNADLALDDASDFNFNWAYDHILGTTYQNIEEKKKAHSLVTEADMIRMAKEIFRPENLTLVIKEDKKDKAGKKVWKKRAGKLAAKIR